MITLVAHALNRVARCNGSHHMPAPEFDTSEEQGEDQREGEAAHYVATEILAGRSTPTKAPNGVFVTDDMLEAIDGFVTDVQSRGIPTLIEQNVDFQLTDVIRILCRLDVATYDYNTGTLTIDEYKHGWRIVEPLDNWQLVAEAAGWLVRYRDTPTSRIILNIHQPRPHHPGGKKRSITYSIGEFGAVIARMRGLLESLPTNTGTATGEHCYRCPAMAECWAHRQSEYNILEAVGTAFSDRLDNDELSAAILQMERAEQIAKQKKTAYRELMTARINGGKFARDWYIEPQLGNTTWNPGVTPSMIKAVTGIDVSKPGMLSPTQAKALKVPETVIKAFSYRPNTGTRLVHKTADQAASRLNLTKPTTE